MADVVHFGAFVDNKVVIGLLPCEANMGFAFAVQVGSCRGLWVFTPGDLLLTALCGCAKRSHQKRSRYAAEGAQRSKYTTERVPDPEPRARLTSRVFLRELETL